MINENEENIIKVIVNEHIQNIYKYMSDIEQHITKQIKEVNERLDKELTTIYNKLKDIDDNNIFLYENIKKKENEIKELKERLTQPNHIITGFERRLLNE